MKLLRITCSLVVLLLSLVAFTFVTVLPAAAQQVLTPPPPSFETCMTVGNGTICQGHRTLSYGPVNAGIVCGSGASTFDIFDSATFDHVAKRSYDQNGNLTRRDIHENYSTGQFSNPLTGAVVPYTQHDNICLLYTSPSPRD